MPVMDKDPSGAFVMAWDDPALRNDVTDGHGHGTHMARIIAGHVPRAEYLIVRGADDAGCTTTWHLMAGLAAVSDCHVLNVSIASSPQATQFSCGPLSDELVSGNLAAIVRDVSRRDAVIVAAAGNKALAHLSYPARVGQAMAIVSVNSKKDLSSFSNHGIRDHEGAMHPAVFGSRGRRAGPERCGDGAGWDGRGDWHQEVLRHELRHRLRDGGRGPAPRHPSGSQQGADDRNPDRERRRRISRVRRRAARQRSNHAPLAAGRRGWLAVERRGRTSVFPQLHGHPATRHRGTQSRMATLSDPAALPNWPCRGNRASD